MRILIACLIIIAFENTQGQDYSFIDRHNDSVTIYEASQKEALFLKNMRESDIPAFQKLQAFNDSLTACIKERLRKWNKESYKSIRKLSRDKLGEVLVYPSCMGIENDSLDPSLKKNPKRYFVHYDMQIKFLWIRNNLGNIQTTGSYITKITHADKVTEEKLDPITWKKIP